MKNALLLTATLAACGALPAAAETLRAPQKAEAKGGANALPGAAGYLPSPENPVGWRGDGSGRYPGATPPMEWYVRLKNCPGLATSAGKPKGPPARLEPSVDIALNDWIGIGPWTVASKKEGLDTAHLPDELTVEPSEGEKAGDKAWKRLNAQNGGMNFAEAFGESPREAGQSPWQPPKQQKVAYAATYVFAPTEGVVALYWTHNDGCRLYCNGTLVGERNGDTYTGKPMVNRFALKQGWNRLLLKTWGHDGTWAFSGWLQKLPPKSGNGYEYESKNIAYKVMLPGDSKSNPIVAGSKIFLCGDHWVAGLNKQDGKLLWFRTILPYDGKAEETKGDAAAAAAYNALCKQIHDLDAQYAAAFAAAGKASPDLDARRKKLLDDLNAQLAVLDPERMKKLKGAWEQSEPGWALTPCCDGQRVYVWSQQAVAACFDLDGKPLWSSTVEYAGNTHHGFSSSPVLVDGLFIGKQYKITAFDAKSGAVRWQVPAGFSWGSMIRAKAGSEWVLCEQDNIIHGLKDGGLFAGDKGAKDPKVNTCSSPIAMDGGLALSVTSSVVISDLNGGVKHASIAPPAHAYCGGHYADGPIASPLYHDGYAYIQTMGGTLWIVDVKNKKLAGSEHMDFRTNWGGRAGSTASPCFANGMLYFFDDSGNTLVREPGPAGKVVARHRLSTPMTAAWDGRNNWDAPGATNSTPVFDESRIYWRFGNVLYCIGEK
ncbi:MAG: PQQ-binding-like beta-propeller repeat protein [Planctomycetota bacterium]|nr:PQQ-binding-like beta-propeller repeat protein [Planctomycetota bacterium]